MAISISCICLIFGIGKVNHQTKGQWFKIFLQIIRETWMKINVDLLYDLYAESMVVHVRRSRDYPEESYYTLPLKVKQNI